MDDRRGTRFDRFLDRLDQSLSVEDIIVFAVSVLVAIAVAIFY